jgi:hypothetical protein
MDTAPIQICISSNEFEVEFSVFDLEGNMSAALHGCRLSFVEARTLLEMIRLVMETPSPRGVSLIVDDADVHLREPLDDST